jgi:hypothetical protein
MRSVLLPTDGSTPALVATAKAVEMAKERDCHLDHPKGDGDRPHHGHRAHR